MKIKLILGASILLLVSVQANASIIEFSVFGDLELRPFSCAVCDPVYDGSELDGAHISYSILFDSSQTPEFIGGSSGNYRYTAIAKDYKVSLSNTKDGLRDGIFPWHPSSGQQDTNFHIDIQTNLGTLGPENINFETSAAIYTNNNVNEELRVKSFRLIFEDGTIDYGTGVPSLPIFENEDFRIRPLGPNLDWFPYFPGGLDNPEFIYLLKNTQISASYLSPIPVIPIPAAVWLFGTALIGLVGFGRRRKAA